MALNLPSRKNSKKIFLFAFCAWWLFWAMLQITMLQGFGVDYLKATVDGFVSVGLLAAACLLIINNMHYYLPGKEKYLY
ncbi:MAG: sensor histidine kinase, partial [Ferruginibacter sp.]